MALRTPAPQKDPYDKRGNEDSGPPTERNSRRARTGSGSAPADLANRENKGDSFYTPSKTKKQYKDQVGSGHTGSSTGAKKRGFFSGWNRRRKLLTLLGGAGCITAAVVALFMSVLPLELVHIKHIVTDEVGGVESHTYTLGRKKLYSSMFFFDKNNQYSGSKVGGIRRLMGENRSTKKMVSALEKNGYQIEFESVNGQQTGRIKSLKKLDANGKVVDSYTSEADLQRAWSIKDPEALPSIMREVFPDKSDFWYNRSTKQLYRRWGLTRGNWLREALAEKTGVNDAKRTALSLQDKFVLALRQKLFGKDLGATAADLTTQKQVDDNKDPTQTTGLQEELGQSEDFQKATSIGASDAAKMLSDPKYVAEGAAQQALDASKGSLVDAVKSSAKSTFSLGNALNPLSLAQHACTLNSDVNTLEMGARTLRAYQLMKFSLSILTMADALQNGKSVDSTQLQALMQYLNSTDSNGKNMFASSGWEYWDPNSKNTSGLFASYDKDQRDNYSAGGGFVGTLADIRGYSNKFIPVGIGCKKLHSKITTAIGFVVGATTAVFTGGTSAVIDAGLNGVVGAFFGFANDLVVHMLAPMVAGTIINGRETGTAVGNALISGAEVLTASNGASTGMRPLTTGEYKVAMGEVQTDQKQEIAQMSIKERLFSTQNDSSLTMTTAMALNNFKFSDLLTGNFSSISNIFGSLFGKPAYAAGNSNCPDSDFKNNNLAATPFCNPVMGIPDSVLNNPAYAPDKIDDTINATEQNVDDYGNPVPGSSYDKYLKQCTAEDGSDTGAVDVIHNRDLDNYHYTNECTNDLFNTYRLYMTIAQGDNDALTGNLNSDSSDSGPQSSAPDATSTAVVSGSAQQLASQVLQQAQSGKIQFNVLNQSDVYDSSTPEQNIRDTAAGKQAKTTTTCSSAGRGSQAPNSSVALSATLLQFILDLSQVEAIQINALAGQCHHETTSNHYNGTAVDFGCPFDPSKADSIGSRYNISDQTGETCANSGHYHYSIGGH